jgi:hypothetical protein
MTTENPVRIQTGKRYKSRFTRRVFTVVSQTLTGWNCIREDGRELAVGASVLLPVEGENYEDEEEKIVRKIKTPSPNFKQDFDKPLREVEINLGEEILIKLDGEETPIHIKLEHKHFFKDDSPKKVDRLELSGVVIPQEIKKMRLIRR